MNSNFLFFISLLFVTTVFSQQITDTLYNPKILSKAYQDNSGPLLYIDEGHHNFHTKNNRFSPFSKVLTEDGYRVVGFNGKFEKRKLKEVRILVISNALAPNSRPPFVTPTKTAFSKNEIENIEEWVYKGGSLFLIADHMPFAGASANLAHIFGFEFYDGFVLDKDDNGILDFSLENMMLNKNSITNGRNNMETVRHIRTFTGQAFKIPKKASSILNLKREYKVFMTDTMWRFNSKTPKFPATNLSQGAILKHGKGRVAVFGEAAMFTAQIAGRNRIKVGMNSDKATENYQLLLNVIHWLDHLY
ncbi:hypothetical protein AWE51_03645 [Aquimarina aggregata]|uniref:DUF4350 domain-containing protein n=1 Tax=Aquimarina aggregata TaxID=1642818 RepID=A0A162DM89_9FLAO|nr:hypothetical protein [Aquimarina aggregata]KZS42548.1 hypothetical protein AWE51_03645 [Aquimarina aggregata]